MASYRYFLPVAVAAVAVIAVAWTSQTGILASLINQEDAYATGIDDLKIYLGYADVAPNFNSTKFPDPWEGSPNTIFVGNGVGQTLDYDSGAIRIDNPTSSNITISSVTVDLPGTECNPAPYGCRPTHFDIWPRNIVIPGGQKLILTENSPQISNMSNFDSSDRNFTDCSRSYWSPPDIHDPLITITTPSESQIINDTGHILDRGGMDVPVCIGNESASWTPVWPPASAARPASKAAGSNVTTKS